MLVVSTEGATHVGKLEGTDGVFEVPPEVAEHLLKFPGWRQATEKEAAAFPTKAPSDPTQGATALSAMDTPLPDVGTDKDIAPVVLPDPQPVDALGNPIPTPEPSLSSDPSDLKGAALADALTEAGLPHTGTADEKRASLEPQPPLKGADLEAALTEAGLPHTGTADEKRAALAALNQVV